ncbi:SCP2 sterol-binding domain-containing protein [Actinophytocola oryzae]|uniref:SCP2 sterol-binding domain-containing protein n=1 Tax=Actinophytocola oryzae TaxID=502181 RepID=UPI001FBBC6B1|nr:SCP2 sterol-binding domain-containing protein [Actinophytocola oryzae]
MVNSTVDIDAFARAVDPELLDEPQFVQLIDVMDMLGRAGTGVNLAAMRTETFVWFVSRASTAQLDSLMAHPHLRHVVLGEIFRRMTEHLDPKRAAKVDAVVHWRFTGAVEDYDRFETVIENGTCRSGTEPTADPRVTLTLAPADFLRVVTGGVNVAMLFMRGRVKVRGDIAFAAGLINYFDLPRP